MSSLLLPHEQRINGPWVKLQSEPKLFNALMYDLGVRGAQATEVFVLDDTDNFHELGEIYGFVYLFRMMGDVKTLYKSDEYTPVENPKNVYFANQVVDNACATLAVLNIALNSPQLEIGTDLREFKEFTKDFPPPVKGFTITNHPSFRLIHNSMARFTFRFFSSFSSLIMAPNYTKYFGRHPEEALVVEEASGKPSATVDESVEVYHYIAYVPVDGEVWQLDGLYPHPVSVGKYSDKQRWYDAARDAMRARTRGFYAEQINFVLLAITKDPINIKQMRIKECIYLKRIVESVLDEINGEWRVALVNEPEFVEVFLTEDEEMEVAKRDNVTKEIQILNSNRGDVNKLIQLRTNWVDELRVLQKAIERENKLKKVEKERQTFDYGPFIREYISILQERGDLKELLKQAEEEDCDIVF
ncbi:3718_t:CDS:2 [Funneliformis geosporum]|uniref:ubiquitinyl hydrolase 1 n=1 Tax=Funneliformis geosporum TaxID=1117311 RepID=A0A9W4SCC9_9GLOM|nr:3332_t:CDS:2 [Funneliformis geosporum]CAI2171869.1 3718_t:CDS:2 [Funneliformis geosporum]